MYVRTGPGTCAWYPAMYSFGILDALCCPAGSHAAG